MLLSFLILSILITLAQCQTYRAAWSANFYMTTPVTGTGSTYGTVKYSWVDKAFYINFPWSAGNYAETYLYNDQGGYAGSTLSQYLFSTGGTCDPACGVVGLTTTTPPLDVNLGGTYLANNGVGTGTGSCLTYTPRYTSGANASILQSFTATTTGVVCSFTLTDSRTFTILQSTFVRNNQTVATPSGCSCNQALDVHILSDHSGSISDSEMVQQKTFVQQFLNSLAISPTQVNVGLSWFHISAGQNFPLTGVLSNINAGMSAWYTNCSSLKTSFCYGPDNKFGTADDNFNCYGCQAGATATSAAIAGSGTATQTTWPPYGTVPSAINYLYSASSRPVPKMFITITDGAVNMKTNLQSCSGSNCDADLKAAVTALRARATASGQPLTTIVVGVGTTSTTLSSTQLLALAEGVQANVLTISNFAALSAQITNLLALTCTTSNNLVSNVCGASCCGLCVCGSCIPPTNCTNSNMCTQQVLSGCTMDPTNPGGCVAQPINPCPQPTNLCNVSKCDPTLNGGTGGCSYSMMNCSSLTQGCQTYDCDSRTGTCSIPNRSACPPINCVWGAWTAWSNCNASCGGGWQTSSRVITTAAADNGTPCSGSATQTQACNSQCCAVNCVVGVWSAWSACSVTCGPGTQTRTRDVITPNSCSGTACPTLTDNPQSCGTACCSVDCSWSAWSTASACTVSCGGGTSTQTRTIAVPATCSGAQCSGSTTYVTACNQQPCPIDCVGGWSAPNNCSCTTNTQTRYYVITTPALYGGNSCPNAAGTPDVLSCTPTGCPVACVGAWGSYTTCSCANNSQWRSYTITTAALNGGQACPNLNGDIQSTSCNPTGCPVNCVGSFGANSTCSCTTNSSKRVYSITTPAANSGTACPFDNGFVQENPCTPTGCPVNCVGAWGSYSTCSCTNNSAWRQYSVSVPALNGGLPCESADKNISYITCVPVCPIACVGTFSSWTTCDCVKKNQTRVFSISVVAQNSGTPCPFADGYVDVQTCVPENCPTPCVEHWTTWTTCDCNTQTTNRTYIIDAPPTNGGTPCSRSLSENNSVTTSSCTPSGCAPVPCTYGEWSAWSSCPVTCGGGTQTASRSVVAVARYGGVCNPSVDGVTTQTCNTNCCPVDCLVTQWSTWTECSASCAGGTQTHSRTPTRNADCGGNNTLCTQLSESRACNTQCCPVACVWNEWSLYTGCSKSCGSGTQYRNRTKVAPICGGASCVGSDSEVVNCNTVPCPVDCVGAWSSWGTCPCDPFPPYENRTFLVTTLNMYGGNPCSVPAGTIDTSTTPCTNSDCPDIDCVGDFSAPSECSCETSKSTSIYTISVFQLNRGNECPHAAGYVEEEDCVPYCPTPCVGVWGDWAVCNCVTNLTTREFTVSTPARDDGYCEAANGAIQTESCEPLCVNCVGDWVQTSICSCTTSELTLTYTITVPEANDGIACPEVDGTTKQESCTPVDCPEDCVEEWSTWTTCDCALQTTSRTYTITSADKFGGVPCLFPDQSGLVDTASCIPADGACSPENCVYSDWTEWSACPVTCGGGTQTATRSVTKLARYGGTCTEPESDTQDCGTACCPEDCVISDWGAWDDCSASCGGGTQTRHRSVVTPLVCGGVDCPSELDDTRDCNTQCCPVDCVWGSFEPWTTCSVSCGGGVTSQTRFVSVPLECGGAPCLGNSIEYDTCNTAPCPIDCIGDYGTPSECSCTTNQTTSVYIITTVAEYNGMDCEYPAGDLKYVDCTPVGCPVDCVGDWTEWTTCDCDTSTTNRTFVVSVPAQNNGVACEAPNSAVQIVSCTGNCKVDCVGDWGPNTTCDCQLHENTRTFIVTTFPEYGGATCIEENGFTQTNPCTPTCPIPCNATWGDWTVCSCVTNQTSRVYTITSLPQYGGDACEVANNTVQTVDCTPICPRDCVGNFDAWSTCDCTTNTQTQTFIVSVPVLNDGNDCDFADGFISVPQSCTPTGCPVNCVDSWSSWSTCSCFNNTQSRVYRITTNASNGGNLCALDWSQNGQEEISSCVGGPECNCGVVCTSSADCDDKNPCTQDLCRGAATSCDGKNHCDWSVPTNCSDGDVCTTDTCDPDSGCHSEVTMFCGDGNVCTDDVCHPVHGCQNPSITCPDEDSCLLGTCNNITGCNAYQRTCPVSGNCSVSYCDANYTDDSGTESGPCRQTNVCGGDIGTIVGIGLGAALGIALGLGFLCAALVAGLTYALASLYAAESTATVTTNPLYHERGLQGKNPFYSSAQTPRV